MKKHFLDSAGIWLLAFGYFICYWPYSAITKALSKGLFPGMQEGVPSFQLLPVSAITGVLGLAIFLTIKGWWNYGGRKKIFGINVFYPNKWTFMSGLCCTVISTTTTLAYTFSGVSIVFVMVLMRSGVLIIAPVTDFFSKRKVKWYSWAGLILSLISLIVTFSNQSSYHITFLCAINIILYLISYFIRLKFMSNIAKSDKEEDNIKYFVEEQLVTSPVILIVLIIMAFINYGGEMKDIGLGFTEFLSGPFAIYGIIMGLLSSGTGFFGGLILLNKRENTYCVPINRCSSVLAGILASYSLMILFNEKSPEFSEIIGAGFIIIAMLFLTIPGILENRSQNKC